MCSDQYGNIYGAMTFGNLDNKIITFPNWVLERPFQRILLYAAAAAVAL